MSRRIKPSPPSFCEIPENGPKISGVNKSAFYPHKGDFRWRGIVRQPYKTSGTEWSNIIRTVLIGAHGESVKFHVRYFEIGPRGCSSLEKHRHEHVVICVKGEGIVTIGKKKKKTGFMDVVYIAPNEPHQLSNPFERPFGFLCIVNARRDRPKVLG